MSDAKTMSSKATIKPEAFQTTAEAGKKAFMAYVEAGMELGGHMDRLARQQAGHFAQATKETAELVGASLETSIKARETARKATVELIEGAFAAAK